MASIIVVDKYTQTERSSDTQNIVLITPSIVTIPAAPEQLERSARLGNDLHISLDAAEIAVANFFSRGASSAHDLVFTDAGQLWHVDIDTGADAAFARIDSIRTLLHPAPAPAAEVAEQPAPPAIFLHEGLSTGEQPLRDGSSLISGKAVPGHTVHIYDKGELIASAIADAEGAWAVSPEALLRAGSHEVTVTQVSEAGLESAPSEGAAFLIVQSPEPLITIDRIVTVNENGSPMDTPRKNALTSGATLLLSGKGEPNSVVMIAEKQSPGDTLAQTTTDAMGNWTASVTLEQMRPHELVAQMSAWDHVLTSVPVAINVVMDASVIAVINAVDEGLLGYIGDFVTGTTSDDSAPELHGQQSALQQAESVIAETGNNWSIQMGTQQAIESQPAEGGSAQTVTDGESVMRLGALVEPGASQHIVLPDDPPAEQAHKVNPPLPDEAALAGTTDSRAVETGHDVVEEPTDVAVIYGDDDRGLREFTEPEQVNTEIGQPGALPLDELVAIIDLPADERAAADESAQTAISKLFVASPLADAASVAADAAVTDLPKSEDDLLVQQSAALNLY